MSEKVSVGGGLGILEVLTVVFIVLKLVEVINWSWWWVLAPFWMPLGVVFVILFFVLLLTKI